MDTGQTTCGDDNRLRAADEPSAAGGRRHPFAILFLVAIGIELAVFVWLCLLDRDTFLSIATAPDTGTYVKIAQGLIDTGTVPLDGFRTLGYPLFLYPCLLIGGPTFVYQVAVAFQLIFNLLLVWLFWKFLERAAAPVAMPIRLIMTAIFFAAGMGLALWILTDFQAGLLFGLFIYCLLFKRSWPWVIVGGLAIGMATLTRPTFTAFAVLIPVAALLARRFTSKVPWSQVAVYVLCSLLACGINSVQTYRSRNVTGSDSFTVFHMLCVPFYNHIDGEETDLVAYKAKFQREIAERAGRPYSELTRAEKEPLARQWMTEKIMAHPGRFVLGCTKSFLKYLFVPIERPADVATATLISEDQYYAVLRPILFGLCLPLWILSIFPPLGHPRRYMFYYLIVVVLVLYVLGWSSLVGGAGERYRFPVLAALFSLAALNLQSVVRWASTRKTAAKGAPRLTSDSDGGYPG